MGHRPSVNDAIAWHQILDDVEKSSLLEVVQAQCPAAEPIGGDHRRFRITKRRISALPPVFRHDSRRHMARVLSAGGQTVLDAGREISVAPEWTSNLAGTRAWHTMCSVPR